MLWAACGFVVALAGFYVLIPLFGKSEGNSEKELRGETERDRLLDRKAALYGNIKDLELEYAMGRLTDADFQQLASGYKNEAAAILQKLDRLGDIQAPDAARVKAMALHGSKSSGSGNPGAQNSSRCPSCGAEYTPGKQFCADCGRRI
jgi:hypothetical protein